MFVFFTACNDEDKYIPPTSTATNQNSNAKFTGTTAVTNSNGRIVNCGSIQAVTEGTTNLQQAANALTELLDNSMKFATDGRVTLHVDIDDSSTKLIFTVEDTGSGIPVAEAEHVFEKGVRLNNYFDGDGMGLTVARSIARRMGGDLILDTSYVGGTRFVMTLPI
jgi:signal transduction histidine kinase